MNRTLSEISRALSLPMSGPDVEGLSPALLNEAGPGSISVAVDEKYARTAEANGVSALIVGPEVQTSLPHLRSDLPRVSFAHLLALFSTRPVTPVGIHPSAVVSPTATVHPSAGIGALVVIEDLAVIGERAHIDAGCFVGTGTTVGDDSSLGPGVRVYDGCVIGSRVRILAGAVIGGEGFGYEWDGTQHVRVPHLGRVIIEDDVDIGANSTVDRGKTGDTVIGRGSKLDNLVQIGHGVRVGPFTLMAAQVGVGGSTVVGAGSIFAGQAGVADNLTVGARSILAAQSGAIADLDGGETYMGMPCRPATEARRILAGLSRLPDLFRRVRALERGRESGE